MPQKHRSQRQAHPRRYFDSQMKVQRFYGIMGVGPKNKLAKPKSNKSCAAGGSRKLGRGTHPVGQLGISGHPFPQERQGDRRQPPSPCDGKNLDFSPEIWWGSLTGENRYGWLKGRRRDEERTFWERKEFVIKMQKDFFLNTQIINVNTKRGEGSAIRKEGS